MAPSTSATAALARPPALQEATKNATVTWQNDLQSLFDHAKERFPDVVWELVDEHGAEGGKAAEEVWGHKAIVYARAPPTFQARYFQFRPAPIASPMPYSYSPTGLPAQSAVSLSITVDVNHSSSRSPSPFRSGSPTPTASIGTLLRLTTSINPTLFSNELEYLYTGKGFGEAFEFLFDSAEARAEGDAQDNRLDKLRKDFVFMWRSRLYSDVRISLTGVFSSTNHEPSTAIFSSHRFMLASRSPYFRAQFLTFAPTTQSTPGEPLTVTLPSPPFTPASLHFTLGFIYTGTLAFSHRTFDLDTAFAVMRSAAYLSLNTLYDELQARVAQEMMHGLFHAFLEFSEYERITEGKWGTGGCRCRQCARRVPRILEFAIADDVKNPHLERGARRALVGIFGEGWCTPEFAALSEKTRDGVKKGLAKRTTPLNIFPLLWAANAAMAKLSNVVDTWGEVVRKMVIDAQRVIDDTLASQPEECFQQPEFIELLESDGVRFEDADKLELVLDSVRRGLNVENAGIMYQAIVSSIILRPHPTEAQTAILSSTSQLRAQVEQARFDVIRHLRKTWIAVRQNGGFDTLEGWALKEISHELELSPEDLLTSTDVTKGSLTRTGLRTSLPRNSAITDAETESGSMHSMRTSVVSRSVGKTPVTARSNGQASHLLSSSAASVRSAAPSTVSTTSRASVLTAQTSPSSGPRAPPPGPRPDSKLTPGTTSLLADNDGESTARPPPSLSLRPNVASVAERKKLFQSVNVSSDSLTSATASSSRPRSAASVRSTTTIRKTAQASSTAGPSRSKTLRPPSSASARPSSSASDASDTYKSLSSENIPSSASARIRTSSANSARSSLKSPAPGQRESRASLAPSDSRAARPRRSSVASSASVASSLAPRVTIKKAGSGGPTTPTRIDSSKTTPNPGLVSKRSPSTLSVRSTASTKTTDSVTSAATKRKSPASPKTPGTPKIPNSSTAISRTPSIAPSVRSTVSVASKNAAMDRSDSATPTTKSSVPKVNGQATIKGKEKAITLEAMARRASVSSTPNPHRDSVSTVKSLPRKTSSETIKEPGFLPRDAQQPVAPSSLSSSVEYTVRGASLEIGIPCIVSSKRMRFRAFARYIGEVVGELGPWVGVEVPVSENWASDKLEGRQWNDGSWGGIRYFDIGTSSEWGDDDRGTTRRRADWGSTSESRLRKREGEELDGGRGKRFRSVSPAISDVSTSESRGLFVRPQQVLYVVDAVGSDL